MKSSSKKRSATRLPAASAAPPTTSSPTQQVQVPLIYADGFGNVLITPINTRVTLVLNVGPAKDGGQPTVPIVELVIPTPALMQFTKQLQGRLDEKRAELATAYQEASKKVTALSE